jgi:2-iminoacetate synthase ThiH
VSQNKSEIIMNKKLIENIDYYRNESGDVVFTKTFHLKRGRCCGNGCRHCPWKDDDKTEDTPTSNIVFLSHEQEHH